MNKALRYISIIIVILICLITNTSCVNLSFVKKTFQGKVIDADTKEPIEGAVVVAHWLEAWDTLAGEGTRTKEVKETLTNKNGEWSIRGPKGRMHGFWLFGPYYTKEPSFIIFKPGYCSWPNGFSVDVCKERIKPKGTGEIMKGKTIELPNLKNGVKMEDILKKLPYPASGEISLEKELIRLINEDRRNHGLDEYKIF